MHDMLLLAFIGFATFSLVLPYCSEAEWGLHKYVMHRPFFGFEYPFVAHDRVHHNVFKFDDSYHLNGRGREVIEKIRMAFWNAPVIIAIGGMPIYLIAGALGYFWWPAAGWVVGLTSVATFFAYYGVYEYMHWCFHLPRNRRLEFSWIFQKLNAHHLIHHRHKASNLNVVLPFADWIHKTLLHRAKVAFAQPRGPSVPDVQPVFA